MKPASAKTCLVAAAIVLAVGFLVPAPAAAFAGFVIAAISALVPAIFGPRPFRLPAALVFLVAGALAVTGFPDASRAQSAYMQRVKAAAQKDAPPAAEPAKR